MTSRLSRRSALRTLAGGAMIAGTGAISTRLIAEEKAVKLKGKINHSVCRWCYGKIELEDLCQAAVAIGLKSIELQGPKEWPILKQHGLTCAMGHGAGMGIPKGFNRVEYHDQLVADYEKLIPQAAAAGIPSVICFSGNRDGMDDDEGLANCAKGLKRLMKLAEEQKVNVVMELLNSKVDHKDYMCDRTPWGVALSKQIGSPRFGLLYDIYHMQIMEGDIIATIRASAEHIRHYHTGGVPGRNEIDQTQEINYPAVMQAIVESGYQGYVGQEFIPKQPDALASLRRCVEICDV